MSQFFKFYQNSLITRPKLTNSLTTGFLFGSGDVLAQLLFPEQIGTDKHSPFDYKRTARSVIYGSLIFSFIGDKWYKILSKVRFPGNPLANPKLDAVRNTITKTALDQLGWAPVGIPLYFTCMSTMEGKSLDQTKKKVQDNWWPTLKANWAVWPIFQLFNLGLVPVQHQLLTVNLVSIAWNTFLSMRNALNNEHTPVHFPPVPE